jgi:hypothetical protein
MYDKSLRQFLLQVPGATFDKERKPAWSYKPDNWAQPGFMA